MEITSPYKDQKPENWLAITKSLIEYHPLSIEEIMTIVHLAWEGVWSTKIGSGDARFSLHEINPPATVIGYFFEKLLGKELANRYPTLWVGGNGGEQKDLHYIPDRRLSIEVKSSGQLGLKIYGNRSYGQEIINIERAKKDKSGFYITVNFYESKINLVRFGWIDGSDWQAQKSSTGQMAGLKDEVYSSKLISIGGDYTLDAPVQLLNGVGDGTAKFCNAIGIFTIREVLQNSEKMTGRLDKVLIAAQNYHALRGG